MMITAKQEYLKIRRAIATLAVGNCIHFPLSHREVLQELVDEQKKKASGKELWTEENPESVTPFASGSFTVHNGARK